MWTSWLNQQFQVPNGPDTTPILQLADTCCIAVGKIAGEKCKEQLALQLREQAKRENTSYKAQFGAYEIFTVAEALCSEPQKRQSTRDVILAQCMKSQLLVLRPDAQGHLHKVEDEAWAVKFPRFPVQSGLQHNWVCQRFSHLLPDPEGGFIAPVPEWDELNEGALDQSCFFFGGTGRAVGARVFARDCTGGFDSGGPRIVEVSGGALGQSRLAEAAQKPGAPCQCQQQAHKQIRARVNEGLELITRGLRVGLLTGFWAPPKGYPLWD